MLAACQLASAAVAARDVKPVYKNFKAVADDGRCTLMATDLELGIRLEVRGLEVDEPGEAILPAGQAGLVGAHVAQRLPARVMRVLVVSYGVIVALKLLLAP